MAIRWKDIFRALGAGASYAAESMREERIDKREEQQAMQRARYMDYLERRRLSMSQAFQKKMAEHEAELQLKNQIRKKEIDTMFDTLGVTLTRKALQNQQLPTGDPNKDKNQAQIDMAMNMMAEAKGGKTDFSQEEMEMLPVDFRMAFTSTVLGNQRLQQELEMKQQESRAQIGYYQAMSEQARGLARFYENKGQGADRLQYLEQSQKLKATIDDIKNSQDYRTVERMLAGGAKPQDIQAQHPEVWSAFLRSNSLIEGYNALSTQYAILGGMPLADIPQYQKDVEASKAKPKKKEKTLGFHAGALKDVPAQLTEAMPGAQKAAKIITPHEARSTEVNRALRYGLRRARKKHGKSVLTYEQAMDLKDKGPKMAEGHMFVAIDPKTRKAATFEFIIKEGRLAIKRVD